MENKFTAQLQVFSRDNQKYQQALKEYNEDQERSENLGIQPTIEKPQITEETKFVEAILYQSKLKDMGFCYYLIHAENDETITLCFEDGTVMILKEEEKIKEILNKIYDND